MGSGRGICGTSSLQEKEQLMEKKDKNPLLAGLMNVLIPGSSHLYVNKDIGKFMIGLIIGGGALVLAVLLGSMVQNARGYMLPQGACMGSMILVVVIVLFFNGRKVARERNSENINSARYNGMRRSAKENEDKTKIAGSKPG